MDLTTHVYSENCFSMMTPWHLRKQLTSQEPKRLQITSYRISRVVRLRQSMLWCMVHAQANLQHRKTTKDKRGGNCGNFHDLRSLCPAYRTRCEACGKISHWKSVCRTRYRVKQPGQEQSKDWPQKKKEKIHPIDTAEQSTETPPTETTSVSHLMATPQLHFHSLGIKSVSKNDTQALLQLQVDSVQVTAPLLCKIDTGAEGNVIPVDTFKHLCPQSSYSSDGTPLGLTLSITTITAFGDHTIPHYGTCEVILSYHGHPKSCAFHVVNTVGPTILGLPTCRDMKLVTLNYGIATRQTRAAPMPSPQGSADPKSELLCQYQDCF